MMTPSSRNLLLRILVLAAISLAGCPKGGPDRADYGDAPDNMATGYPSVTLPTGQSAFATTARFPTLHASKGARTLSTADATLGPTASLELDANDPADPDGAPNLAATPSPREDDGVTGLTVVLTQIPPPAVLAVDVVGQPGGKGGTFYLNVLIDLDLDGDWGGGAGRGEPEWVARNVVVEVVPGETKHVQTEPFAFSNGFLLPDRAWMRVALTRERVTAEDWDGSGQFSSGEIEDHIIELPKFPDQEGKAVGIPNMVCRPNPVDMANRAQAPFRCTITNMGLVADSFAWELERLSGGVVVAPPLMGTTGVLLPTQSEDIDFIATKGPPMPSRWRYTAEAVDPPSKVTATGVIVGYEVPVGGIDFVDSGSSGGCIIHVKEISTSVQHFSGYSDAIYHVKIVDASGQPVAGALVKGSVEGPTSSPEVSGTTNASGVAELRHRTNQYGDYYLTLASVAREGCEHDASQDEQSGAKAGVY